MSMKFVGFMFSNRALPSVCEEQPIALAIAWVVWGFQRAPMANKSIRCNPFWLLEALFGGDRYLVGALSPSLVGTFV